MPNERYPGERRGLRLFLAELLPAVERDDATADGGAASILRHAVRRAVASGDLLHLRHARQVFNHLPRERRQTLSAAMLGLERRPPAAASVPAPAAAPGEPPAPSDVRGPAPVICLEALKADEGRPGEPAGSAVRVGLRHEPGLPPAPVRVLVRPGTLPSEAADALRRVAAMIEADRRLLSARFWEGRPAAATVVDGETGGDGRRDARQ